MDDAEIIIRLNRLERLTHTTMGYGLNEAKYSEISRNCKIWIRTLEQFPDILIRAQTMVLANEHYNYMNEKRKEFGQETYDT